ncbi:MAG: phosphate ABC transporter substrate-binding protein [Gammaproteobacteria bacterium]|nr:phosphate ABC transporter substrate-binding protein [Gammaproteobacteria bacterium]
MNNKLLLPLLSIGFCLTTGSAKAALPVDSTLPDYSTTSELSGTLSSVGSDSLEKIMQQWQATFKQRHPNVQTKIKAKGSSTAPKALIKEEANIGPMSRKMKRTEVKAFKEKYGYKPTKIPVAMDTLAIYVHKDNPIKGLRFADLDSIFSHEHKCGKHKEIKVWGDLGLTGKWKNQTIHAYGRNKKSGTYGYIKKRALCNGAYGKEVSQEENFESITKKVAVSLGGIGYASMAYQNKSVRIIPMAKSRGQKLVLPTPENTLNRHYPLGRFLYVYINRDPTKPVAEVEWEFIKLMLSKQGQEIISNNGYIPLSLKMIKKTLKKLKKVK